MNVNPHASFIAYRVAHDAVTAVNPSIGSTHHYILAPAPKPEPREAVAYVVKRGDEYLYSPLSGAMTPDLACANRWAPSDRPVDIAAKYGARIVKLVRKRGTP